MLQRQDFEIMAPVGSYEALYAAFQAHADAVYFGVGRLNMRAHSAGRFMLQDISKITSLCHEHSTKAYLTVNTVLYDEDFEALAEVLHAAKKAYVDAIIATDIACLTKARELGLRVHLSTQLNISNVKALEFYAQFADVVVLARELNLNQVTQIAKVVDEKPILGPSGEKVRLEMFCHGALCMAVSGKCYMSLATRGKSANRGECLQTCRRAYLIKDKERDIELEVDNEYVLSPKDLKTIAFMDKMIGAGVRVFKIEGRARGAEYVRTVVECYDEAIKAVINQSFNEEKLKKWDERLRTVFNRGFWDGFYLGQKVPDLATQYGARVTERKRFVGKCVNFYAKPGVAEFLIQAQGFSLGDKLLITGPTTGAVYATPTEILSEDKPIAQVHQGDSVTFKVGEKVRAGDQLYCVEKVAIET